MTKKLISLLIVIIFSMTFVSVIADASDGYTNLVFEDDFEDYTEGTPAKWSAPSGSQVSPYLREDGEDEGTAAAFKNWKDSESTGDGKAFYTQAATTPYANLKVEFYINIDASNKVNIYLLNSETASDRKKFITFSGSNCDMKMVSETGVTESKIGNLNPGEWNHVVMYLDFQRGYSEIICNDELLYAGANTFLKDYGCTYLFRFQNTGIGSGNTKYTYIDNFYMYTPEEVTVLNVSPANGAVGFPRVGGTVTVECSRDLFDFDKNVTVTDTNGTKVEDVAVSYSGNVLTVRIDELLNPQSEYKVLCFGNEYKYTTGNEPFAISVPSLDDNGDGTVSASASVYNFGETDIDATLLVASYYAETNKMFAFDYDSATDITSEGANLSKTVAVPEGGYVKAVIVDSLDSLNPLREEFAGGSDFSLSGTGQANLSIESVKLSGDSISLKASADAEGERTIIVKAVKRVEEAQLLESMPSFDFIAPVTIEEDGTLDFAFAPNSGEGWYDIEISGAKLTESAEKSVYFVSNESQNDILELINEAEDTEDIKQIMSSDYNAEFNLGEEYFNDNTYNTVFEQKPYASFEDACDIAENSYELLCQLNDITWLSLTAFLAENENVVIPDSEDYEYYEKLSENKQNTINKKVVSQYETFKQFRKAFEKAVADYKAQVAAALNQQISNNKNSSSMQVPSGGGGGGGGASAPVTPAPVTPAPVKPVFTDLGAAAWAQTPVTFLANKGIISGDGNGNFRPLDNVSREEFVKMIVSVFSLTSNGKAEFTDTAENAWYMPYLAAAKENGIIQGKADGSFGIGEKITRQDMAVMLARAIEASGKNISEGEKVTFADESAFADYAVDAINKLQAGGIISGVGNEKFAPADMANRAQAAQIIYNLFSKEVVK